jgi:DNA-binding response OmpR family regulator
MTNARILIVEDEQALSEAYEIILKKNGYKVRVAHDGQEALEIVNEFNPQLILLDLRMPRISGIQFLQAYEAEAKHPSVKIIVFSNMDDQTEIQQAFNLGASRYLLKAWASPNDLVKLVGETLISS